MLQPRQRKLARCDFDFLSSGSTVRAAETVLLRVAIPSLFRALFFILSHYMTFEKAEHWLEAGHVAVPEEISKLGHTIIFCKQ